MSLSQEMLIIILEQCQHTEDGFENWNLPQEEETWSCWFCTMMGLISGTPKRLAFTPRYIRQFSAEKCSRYTIFWIITYGLNTLLDSDMGADSDLDPKSDGYIVQCRTCSHCTDSDSDSDPYSLFPISSQDRNRSPAKCLSHKPL